MTEIKYVPRHGNEEAFRALEQHTKEVRAKKHEHETNRLLAEKLYWAAYSTYLLSNNHLTLSQLTFEPTYSIEDTSENVRDGVLVVNGEFRFPFKDHPAILKNYTEIDKVMEEGKAQGDYFKNYFTKRHDEVWRPLYELAVTYGLYTSAKEAEEKGLTLNHGFALVRNEDMEAFEATKPKKFNFAQQLMEAMGEARQ